MKLARSIILLLLAAFLALLAALNVVEVRRATIEFEEGLADDMALTGRALRPPVVELWQQEGATRALDVLRRADHDAANMEIKWMPEKEAPAILDAPARDRLAAGQEVVLTRPPATPDRLFVFVPTTAGGAIELSQPIPPTRVILLRILRERLLASFAAVVGAAVLTTIAGVWVVGRPMARLVEHARRIGAGDLSHGDAPKRRDEIGELADEMNKMCDRLIDARDGMAAAADARVRALEQVRRADRLSTVGTLASGMAHELGTPLSIIAGRAKMIAAEEPTSERAQFARIILAQSEKMTRIMRGLLDFARRKPAEKQPVDVRELARRTLDLLTPLAKKRDVVLRLEGDGAAVAEVDAAQVEQAIANLVVNGIHAASTGGGEIVVSTEAGRGRSPDHPDAPEGSWLSVVVKDSGDGIRTEDLPHVFEPFFTTKDVGEGTGLGLSVTYGIVRDHGGFIDVASKVGEGSTFTLCFPMKDSA